LVLYVVQRADFTQQIQIGDRAAAGHPEHFAFVLDWSSVQRWRQERRARREAAS
jgi:hypothetical protein